MGRRGRARDRAERVKAPPVTYTGEGEDALVLRGSLTAKARLDYAGALEGEEAKPGAAREDAYHRAVELLFERLVVSWTVSGVPTEKPRELLERFRIASPAERDWVLARLRDHVAKHFPELPPP